MGKEEERETRGKEKRENGEEKKRNCERERRKPKIIGERYENERRTFFPPFLSLFEITEICLGCTKMEISTGRKMENGKFSNSNLTHL